jgi:hypothetical protein
VACPSLAFALSYKTGRYTGLADASIVAVKHRSFEIQAFSIEDESCNPDPHTSVAFIIGMRGGNSHISGTISPTGKLSATSHPQRTQKVTGHISGRRLTLAVSDDGVFTENRKSYDCHGRETAHLAYVKRATPGRGGGGGSRQQASH